MADILSGSDIAQIKSVIENAIAKATSQGDRAGRAAETERARQMAHALVKEEQNLTVAQAFDELFKRLADNPAYPKVIPVYDDNSPEAVAQRSRLELERRARGEAGPGIDPIGGADGPFLNRPDQLLTPAEPEAKADDERLLAKSRADAAANLPKLPEPAKPGPTAPLSPAPPVRVPDDVEARIARQEAREAAAEEAERIASEKKHPKKK